MSKWPSDNDKEVWFNHKENEWHNNEGEICELYSGVDHDGTKYSFFTNQAYWDCECDENYIHKKTEQKRCTKCDTFHEDQPDSRQHEIDSFVTHKTVRHIDNEERIASILEERRKTLQRLAEDIGEKNTHILDKAFERLAEDRELYASENKEPVITSTEKLIEKIKDICKANIGSLQSADSFSKEFAKIIDLINENTKHGL